MIQKRIFSLSAIIFLGVLARFLAVIIVGDQHVDNEWGVMLKNLEENNILSIRDVNGQPMPNVFMPPLYPLFLYVIKFFFSQLNIFLYAVYFIQILLSAISIYLTYKILLEFYSENICKIGTLIYSIFPLNIYGASQISSITLQLFFINLFILGFIFLIKYKNLYGIITFSISAGFLMLLRGEFFIFFLFSLIFYLLKTKDYKRFFLGLLISIIVISPYLVRNYQIFEVVTITKSGGYNLLKGNNPKSLVEGKAMMGFVRDVVPEVKNELDSLKANKKYDLMFDDILLNQAIIFIQEDPSRYIYLYFKRVVSFLFIDLESTYPGYYSILHIIPKLVIAITTFFSIIFLFRFKFNLYSYFILYYLLNIGLFSVFFILPRYSLSLLTIQIILSLYWIKKFFPKL
tara:strand:- start:130 stop:1335 length:1206 start_codon:yes stop_codon:yes gene_type:complete